MTKPEEPNNEKNNEKFKISSQRKLHDMWALVLYLILFSLFIIVILLSKNRQTEIKTLKVAVKRFNFEDTETILRNNADISFVNCLTYNEFFIMDVVKIIILPIILFGSLLILIYTFTGVFTHVAFLLPIFMSVISAGLCLIYSSFIGCANNSISAILSFILYMCVFRRLKYIPNPLKMAFRVMLSCYKMFLGLLVCFTSVSIGICCLLNALLSKKFSDTETTLASIICGFFSTWTIFLISTISQSAMSAMTAQYIVNDLTGCALITNSIKIILYSLGSACFSALLLALVYTTRRLLSHQFYNDPRAEGNRSFNFLLLMIHNHLSFAEDFLQYLTSWAMTVVALKGCKLTVAMKSVIFDIRTGILTTLITSYMSSLFILLIVVYLVCVLILGCRIVQLKEVSTIEKLDVAPNTSRLYNDTSSAFFIENSKKHVAKFNMLPIYYAIFTLVFLGSITVLLQKIMEMLYLIFTEESDIIKRRDESVYESMKQEEQHKAWSCY
ncbi:hypothetical protein CDIK_2058 [Cucumispora dikerogammari]|nr:hypothetical protein CDIK_2058 [Cucumispora dikerogammari]